MIHHLPAAILFLCLVSPRASALVAMTTTQGTLVKEVRMAILADGNPIGFAKVQPGTRVLILSTNTAGELVVKRSHAESPFVVPQDAVANDAPSGPPPSSPPAPPSVTPTATPAPSSTPQSTLSPSAAPSTPPAIFGIKVPTAQEVNKALGISLFGSGPLWEENDAMVAGRLDWPAESRTSYETGYRWYPYSDNSAITVLGARALSLFLQGINNKVAKVSVLFANKGDVAFYSSAQEAKAQSAIPNQPLMVTDHMLKGCQDAMRHDKATVEAALKALFGESKPARMGRFASTTESGQRWDWNGHTFVLVAPQNEYVALRILPTASIDDNDADRKAFAAAKANLSQRVKHKENGDVVITDLPMIDQGRKGYCVPATFERILRYYGLSEDMNILAMAGQTKAGGGTSVSAIEGATYTTLRDAGAIITQKNFSGSIQEIKSAIDAGKPLLFTHYSTEEFNKRVNERMTHRIAVTNWDDWSTRFLPSLKKTIPLKPDPEYGHICLIIGYNEKTREIAISDSWGRAAKERWMTEDEARQIKQPGALSVIE
ncbi:MAG: C39 family peptidase [Chthoniobacterales bacterium]|jgi:hypothetical protein|nr:C39 family peptidase [Chthoniobacterales bacterium]